MNNSKFIILALSGILTAATLVYSANADISLTGPRNWQLSADNNSTHMAWYQNSTKSVFGIVKSPIESSFPISFFTPMFGQLFAENNILESMDQIVFGKSNFGYRYVLNLTLPLTNLSSDIRTSLIDYPFRVNSQMKGLLILTQKYNGTYTISLISPSANFDRMSNEIKPTLDSILINKSAPSDTKIKWKEYNNSIIGFSLEYPSMWTVDAQLQGANRYSICDPTTGTCFTVGLLSNESINTDAKTFIDGYRQLEAQNSSDMIEPTKMSNYTIDGELSAEGTRRLIQPETGDVVNQKEILAMHDNKIYFLFLNAYPSEVAKPETKKILDHIIKSFIWTTP